jgi:diguanylate cyclase
MIRQGSDRSDVSNPEAGQSGHGWDWMQPWELPEQRAADTSRPADTAAAVVHTMRQLGVVGLPRNYELFYEAISSRRKELTDALSGLGSRPTQQELDEVARRFLTHEDPRAVEDARNTISTKLDEILSLLRKERSSMETYGKILGETSTGLSGRDTISRDFLEKIVAVMATATKTSIDSRSQLVTSISDKSGELQEVKSKLEEYKKLADTDALTQLLNRRAFDRAISVIYDSNRGVAFSALILGDIDRFKTVNDRFGHPVGDRIIQIVAGIVRAAIKDEVFVARTGGEEFAIILEGSGEEATYRLADDIRQAIAEAPFVNIATGQNYGTCMATQAQGPDDLYVKADRALYAAKTAGRNRVTRYSSLTEGSFAKNWLLYRKD